MNIKLQNIGIVRDSTIQLDGLTVITGKNNSGKSTVGKALYSILDATCNLRQKADIDRNYYISTQLRNLTDILDIFYIIKRIFSDTDSKEFLSEKYPALFSLTLSNNMSKLRAFPADSIEEFAHSLESEISELNIDLLAKNETFNKFIETFQANNSEADFRQMLDARRHKALELLQTMFENLEMDADLSIYAKENINQTLRSEFANQIQPVRAEHPTSTIDLTESGDADIHLTICNNQVTNERIPTIFTSSYKKVYFIDDPFVVDQPREPHLPMRAVTSSLQTFLNPLRIQTHNEKLKRVINRKTTLSVFEQTVLDASLAKVKEKIDNVLPGTFDFSSEGRYYIQNGIKLEISNLATGSKMFSLIKILLEQGELDQSTMLILDEPEAHLHPMWQNAFAEMIILLVKELHVNVLLTTHSPNFVLALDAYMRKYSVESFSNFYQTATLEDGSVNYRCVNDDIGEIYQDFVQYLSEVKVLRNQYLSK